MATVVYCSTCGEKHRTSDVICRNIEESIEGWDVLEYVCPETGKIAKAVVRNDGMGDATDEVYGR